MTQANRARRTSDIESPSGARSYEMVMPDEFGHIRSRNYKHLDLEHAIRAVKKMPVGQGVKLKCLGATHEGVKRQKAAIAIAMRMKVRVRTRRRDGWLFIEKLKED